MERKANRKNGFSSFSIVTKTVVPALMWLGMTSDLFDNRRLRSKQFQKFVEEQNSADAKTSDETTEETAAHKSHNERSEGQ